MTKIDSRAAIAPGAELADDVEVGPFCVVGPNVRIGAGSRLLSHVVVDGHTTLGSGCTLHPFCCIGGRTQDLKFDGGSPRTEIGDNTTFREYATVNAATFDGDATVVGSGCHIMAYTHIAHDCIVGDEVIMANAATLAGHVEIEDQAIIGGLVGVHQFVKIGKLSIIGGCAKVVMDVPPFMTADGSPLKVRGINKIGLERHGFNKSGVSTMREAYRLLYRKDLATRDALNSIRDGLDDNEAIQHLINFVESSERGITR